MPTKTKNLFLKICILVAIVCSTLLFVTLGRTRASAEYFAETKETLRESYMLGEKFVIPDGVLVSGENRYQAEEQMLVFPDGTINEEKDQVLSQTGEYALIYAAEIDGETVSAQTGFSVVDSYYSYSGDTAEKSSYAYTDTFNMAPNSDVSGLKLQLANGSTFNVNEAFDVNELTEDMAVASFYSYNNTFLMGMNGKTVQAHDFEIILTDYYDADNYIAIDVFWILPGGVGNDRYASFIHYAASANGSSFMAMASSASGTVSYNGATYIKRNKDVSFYGAAVDGESAARSDFYVDADGKLLTTNGRYDEWVTTLNVEEQYSTSKPFSVYYDNQTKDVYASFGSSKKFVTNVGLSSVYGEKAFKGFTGDKFYVSIRANNYKTSSGGSSRDLVADLEVSTLVGRTGSALLAENMPNDITPPHISVAGIGKELSIAKGDKIAIPAPIVKDRNLKSVVSEVYFAYGTSQQSIVAVKDGCFTPNRLGEYTVLYTAEDTSHNVSKARLNMRCKIFDGNRSLGLNVEEVESPQAGTLLTLPAFELVGENPEKKAKVFYAYNGGSYQELDESGSFFIDHVGEYTVRYEYSDLLVSYAYAYNFTSIASDNVTFNAAVLPKYLLKGATYTLENLYAYKYEESDPTKCKVLTYVSEDEGQFTEINANAYTVRATASVRFKYVLDGKESYSESFPVRNVKDADGGIVLAKYFVTQDFSYEEQKSQIVFTPTKTNSTMEFINPVSVSNFHLAFRIPKGYDNYDGVEVALTDYYDRSKTVKITYVRIKNTSKDYWAYGVQYNGKLQTVYEKRFEDNLWQLFYQANKLYDNAGKSIDLNGVFTGGKVLVAITTLNTATPQDCRLELRQLNNVVLGNARSDQISPQIAYQKNSALYETLGTEITVYPASVADVHTPFVLEKLEMYVKGPNNSQVTALDGTVLDAGCDPTKAYTFKIEKNGRYTVYYKYTDQNGISTSRQYYVYILDNQKPTFELSDGYNENTVVSAPLNETYTVQSYTAYDTVTAAEELQISVMAKTPDGSMKIVKNGTLTLDEKGLWTICYYCADAMGNFVTAYYYVTVE